MRNVKFVTIVDANDEMREVELLSAFEFNKKKYVFYTHNENDYDGHVIIYAGRIVSKYNRQYLVNIEDGNEWEWIKNIMRNMARYGIEVDSNA